MKKKILILSSLIMLFVGVLSVNTFASSFNPDDTFEEVNPINTMSLIYEPDLYYIASTSSSGIGAFVIDQYASFSSEIYNNIISSSFGNYYDTKISLATGLNNANPSLDFSGRISSLLKGSVGGSFRTYNAVSFPYLENHNSFPESPYQYMNLYWNDIIISGRDINNSSTLSICGYFATTTDLENDSLFSGTFSGSLMVRGQQSIEFSVLPFSYEFSINPYNFRPEPDLFSQYFEIDLFSYFFDSFGLSDSDYLVLNNATMHFEYTRPNGATRTHTIGMWGRFDSPMNEPTIADVFNSYDFSDLEPKIDFEDISYVDWIINSVKSFVDFEIFPNFSIGNILGVLISMALAIWILKVFMGG